MALLAGCGGSQPPISAPGAMPQASALAVRTTSTNYKVLYSFGASPDGNYPLAGVIVVGGTLYGTTSAGGSPCGYSSSAPVTCGTVFSITKGGREKVLHSFGAKDDGAKPEASLIEAKGMLYGTTVKGGSYTCGYSSLGGPFPCGTVFSITTNGREKVLHSFGAKDDGAKPEASLIEVKGTLYGTTAAGGGRYPCNGKYTFDDGCGTVFSITPGGTEKVLHSFGPGRHAHFPRASLIDVGGTLYGTTAAGGTHNQGSVFRITVGGRVKVLHSFGNGTDGKTPLAGLIEIKGTFYGTTFYGGARGSFGTVFSITPGGMEKVLHSFGADGINPGASLVDSNGTLYGTTVGGGTYDDGTVFSVSTSGRTKVLHSFGNGYDGQVPNGTLIDVNGTLYGTTLKGGSGCRGIGCGTVFALTP
jgi:uncharacterized repeat protein (TIGR03803 family)